MSQPLEGSEGRAGAADDRVKAAADADDRSVSSWIRSAVDRTLQAAPY